MRSGGMILNCIQVTTFSGWCFCSLFRLLFPDNHCLVASFSGGHDAMRWGMWEEGGHEANGGDDDWNWMKFTFIWSEWWIRWYLWCVRLICSRQRWGINHGVKKWLFYCLFVLTFYDYLLFVVPFTWLFVIVIHLTHSLASHLPLLLLFPPSPVCELCPPFDGFEKEYRA